MKKILVGLIVLASASSFAAVQNGKMLEIASSVLKDTEASYGVQCPADMNSSMWVPALDKTLKLKADCNGVKVTAVLRMQLKGIHNFSNDELNNADYKLERVSVVLK